MWAVFGASLILGIDRLIDGRPWWSVGYLICAAVLFWAARGETEVQK